MNEFATKNDMDGLGGRVTTVETQQAVQGEKNKTFRRDIDANEECITALFKGMEKVNRLASKIIGGVAVAVFIVNAITILIAAKIMVK